MQAVQSSKILQNIFFGPKKDKNQQWKFIGKLTLKSIFRSIFWDAIKMFVKRYKSDHHTSLRSPRHPFYVEGPGKIKFFLGPCSSFMRILINVEKSVIIVLQSLVLRRCLSWFRLSATPIHQFLFQTFEIVSVSKNEKAAFSEITAKK